MKEKGMALIVEEKTWLTLLLKGEKTAGVKRFIVVEDLTPANHKAMKDLQADDRVEKVWSVDGRLRLVLNGDDKSVKKVKSVFDPIDSIIQAAMKAK
jgi:hypothetical protein